MNISTFLLLGKIICYKLYKLYLCFQINILKTILSKLVGDLNSLLKIKTIIRHTYMYSTIVFVPFQTGRNNF